MFYLLNLNLILEEINLQSIVDLLNQLVHRSFGFGREFHAALVIQIKEVGQVVFNNRDVSRDIFDEHEAF